MEPYSDPRALYLDIEGREFDARALSECVAAVDALIRSLRTDGAEDQEPLLITSVTGGSIHLGLAPPTHDDAEVLINGMDHLAGNATVPPGWTSTSVRKLLKTRDAAKRQGVSGIAFRLDAVIARITYEIERNAKQALRGREVSLGSVTGRLFRYNSERRTAGVMTLAEDHKVDISFPEALLTLVRDHLDSTVEIWGEVERDWNDVIVAVNAETVEPLVVGQANVTDAAVRGLLGEDLTDGLDPAEWVRRQRD